MTKIWVKRSFGAYVRDIRGRLLKVSLVRVWIRQAHIARSRLRVRGPGYMKETTIVLDGDFSVSDLGTSLAKSFHSSNRGRGDLPPWVMNMEGMSGRRYRRLVNNLVRSVEDPVYLEVGSWKGSTACAAIASNTLQAICIDDWSQFGGPRDEFYKNIGRVAGNNYVQVIEDDFRAVNFGGLQPKANIFLFDGPHHEADQFDGIVLALPGLQEEFVLVVDDYNWSYVRDGTSRALREKALSVICSVTIRTNSAGFEPTVWLERSDWHNGYFVAVVRQSLQR